MTAPDAPLTFARRGAVDEELARAELYGVLATLWLAPPDAAVREAFATAVTEAPERGGHLEAPWAALVSAVRNTPDAAAQAEFATLFHGIGKAELIPYASYHLAGGLNDTPLAALRQDLLELGLARDAQRAETEDHAAYVLEVMRYLIGGDDAAVCNLEQQRRFFRRHVQSWLPALCASVQAHPRAVLWRRVAELTDAFVAVEAQGFDLLEAGA